MASNSATDGLSELERVAGLLESELAGWRRRCLKAETELDEVRSRAPSDTPADVAALRQRIAEAEAENHRLEERIGYARQQVEQLRTRLRFAGHQVGGEAR